MNLAGLYVLFHWGSNIFQIQIFILTNISHTNKWAPTGGSSCSLLRYVTSSTYKKKKYKKWPTKGAVSCDNVSPGVILEGNLGEKVSLSWLTSLSWVEGEVKMYRMYREIQNLDQNFSLKSWNCHKTSPSLKAPGWPLVSHDKMSCVMWCVMWQNEITLFLNISALKPSSAWNFLNATTFFHFQTTSSHNVGNINSEIR